MNKLYWLKVPPNHLEGMHYLRSSLLLLLSAWSLVSFGQAPPLFEPKSIPTPNAADLGKYGEVPVNLYSGKPNISIPLYEVVNNSLRLPITISYYGDSNKPNEQPGWVGANWTLNVGGAITRTVRGLPDEREDINGYYHNYHVFGDDEAYDWPYSINNSSWSANSPFLQLIEN